MREEFKNMHNHQSEVDPLEIWAAIEPEVDALNEKRRKKRAFFLWFGFGMMIMIIGAGLVWGLNDGLNLGSQEIVEKVGGVQSQVQSQNSSSIEGKTIIQYKNDGAGDGVLNINEEIVSIKQSYINNTKSINIEGNHLNESIKNQSGDDEKTIPSKILVDQKAPLNSALPEWKQNIHIESNTQDEVNKMAVNILNIHDESQEIETIAGNNNSIDLLKNARIKPLQIDDSFTLPSLINEEELATLLEEATLKSKHNRKINLSISLQGGASFLKRNLKVKALDSIGRYILSPLRNHSETPLEAQHYGIRLRAEHRSGFELSLGLNKTTITERFDYRHEVIDTTWKEGVRFIFEDLGTDSVTNIMDEIPTITTTTTIKKVYNSYRLVEIPVTLAYNRQWNKWKIAAQAGVFVNVSLKTEGKILIGEDQIANLESLENPIYKNKIGLAYHFGLSISRQIRPNIALSISPFVRKYTSDFTINDYQLSQKYTLFGGNVSLVYQL